MVGNRTARGKLGNQRTSVSAVTSLLTFGCDYTAELGGLPVALFEASVYAETPSVLHNDRVWFHATLLYFSAKSSA